MFNGALACEFRKYQLFSGSFKDYMETNHDNFKTRKPASREQRPSRIRENGNDTARKSYGSPKNAQDKKRNDRNEHKKSFDTKKNRKQYEKKN